MLKCTGICSSCGRCINRTVDNDSGDSKASMLTYPEGFSADRGEGLAAAFDMGTSAVAAVLWDMTSGQQIATAGAVNPQRKHGADVISRIAYCSRNTENLQELRELITGCINNLAVQLCRKSGTLIKDIRRAAVCGNTTMSHIFAGYSPEGLAMAPFSPAYTGTLRMSADEAMLDFPVCGEVAVLPGIAGHVGGDVTAGLVASGFFNMNGLTLFMDIGTNGELVLTDGNETYACSAAAGPAFGGAGDISGSELLDAIAWLLNMGLVDNTGRLIGADERFVPVGGNKTVAITQRDIRDVQLAKGAIGAGIELMLKTAGKTAAQLDRVIVAGAFGNRINKSSALRVGLVPDISPDRIIPAGNAAGAGVSMALVNADAMELAERIPRKIKHLELAEEPEFQETFLSEMGFGGKK